MLKSEKSPLNVRSRIATPPYRFCDDTKIAFLKAVASAAFERFENHVQLELLSVLASPELREPDNLRTFVSSPP